MMTRKTYNYFDRRIDDISGYQRRLQDKVNSYQTAMEKELRDIQEGVSYIRSFNRKEINKLNEQVATLTDQVNLLMDLIKVKYEEVPAHTRLVEKDE